MVTVQAPTYSPPRPEPVSLPEPHPLRPSSPVSPQNSRPRFIHVPLAHPEPPVQRIQPQPQPQPITKPTQPQYGHPMFQYSPHVGLPPTLRYPNNTFLLPQRIRKPTITEEDEARKLAAKKHKWGKQTMEVGSPHSRAEEYFRCRVSLAFVEEAVALRTPFHHSRSTPLPFLECFLSSTGISSLGSNLQHPVMVILHPAPPQCAPACQPVCHVQCTSRLQYLPMPMPEFFHQYPTCRQDWYLFSSLIFHSSSSVCPPAMWIALSSPRWSSAAIRSPAAVGQATNSVRHSVAAQHTWLDLSLSVFIRFIEHEVKVPYDGGG